MGTTLNESAWSTTPGTNATADLGIVWSESQDAATVNDSARGMMAARAKTRLDQGGGIAAAGTANAITLTTNQVLSAAHVAAGLTLKFRATATNTGATTLAPDGLSPVAIVDTLGRALSGGEIQSGAIVEVAYNANTSKWQLVSGYPTPGMVLLASGSASGASLTLTLTSYAAYRALRFVLTRFIPATDAVGWYMRISTGGSTITTNYRYGRTDVSDAGTASSTGSTNASAFVLATNLSNGSDYHDADVTIFNPAANITPRVMWQASWLQTGTVYTSCRGGGMYTTAAQVTDAVRFLFSAGNITSGTYAVYGLM